MQPARQARAPYWGPYSAAPAAQFAPQDGPASPLVRAVCELARFPNLHAKLTFAATGSAPEAKAILTDFGGHAHRLMAEELRRLGYRVQQIDDVADSPVGWDNGVGGVVGRRGLHSDERKDLERTIADASTICPPGNETSISVPDWSPDASKLVFAVVCDDGRFASTSAEIVSFDGTGLRTLPIDGLDTTRIALSPDGTRVAFVAESERLRIGTSRLDGTGRTAVVRDESGAAYLDLDW